jgi:hypothetical protein
VLSRPRILIIGAFLLLSAAGFSQEFSFDGIELLTARAQAMGGMHAALADDTSTLLTNPAGFRGMEPHFAIAEVTANLTGPVFSIADIVVQAAGGDAGVASLITSPEVLSLFSSLYAKILLNGPLAFGYVGNGLGFGFFNSSGVTLTSQGAIPTISASIHEDVLFIGGYAVRIPLPGSWRSTFDVGVSIKTFARASVELSESILNFLSFFTAPPIDSFMALPFNLDVGFGIDAGLLYSWNETISVGIVGRDLYCPVVRNGYDSLTAFTTGGTSTLSYDTAPIDLCAGIMYSPDLGFLANYITDVKVLLDYSDILDFLTHPATATNPALHVGIGLEFVLLDVFSLRGGFNEGYFSAGMGLNLTVFRLNLAMYGTELSTEPGIRPAYNLLVGLQFGY